MDALLVLAIVFLITQLVAAAVLLAYRKEHGERPGDAKAYFDVGIRARMAASIPALVLVICWLGAFVLSDGELHDDLGCRMPATGYLKKWTDQGVLLLNAVLTVRAGAAGSHSGMGWEIFTDRVIELLNQRQKPIVFMLWGRFARSKKNLITNPNHLILEAAHPSPLSAYHGFFGCRHFSKANAFLEENGMTPIDWQIEPSYPDQPDRSNSY